MRYGSVNRTGVQKSYPILSVSLWQQYTGKEFGKMPALNVFISHISEEKDMAVYIKKRFCDDFLNLVSVFVSSDTESISAGAWWLPSINEALKNAGIVLILCSRASLQRPWINFEAGAAWMHGTTMIPVCHTGLKPGELPMPLAMLNGVSISSAAGWEKIYSKIAAQLGCKVPHIDFAAAAAEICKIEAECAAAGGPQLPNSLAPNGAAARHNPIQQAIDEARLGWTLCFIGEDQSDKLAVLTGDLSRDASNCGDGKQFASGFSYWGIGPALAWARACSDPFYLVMKNSIESFPERWDQVKPSLDGGYHYVSLGVGTGSKDRRILFDLGRIKADLYYFPVDMSPEMLRVGIKELLGSAAIPRSRLLPIQIDFSIDPNVLELRRMLSRIVGNDGILYSLLGNTLANFERDTELLRTLSVLLRPQDRLLLEVASTGKADNISAKTAAEEYAKSTAFKQFVISALLQYTDLPAGLDTLTFVGAPEGRRSILVKVIYGNRSRQTVPMKLPDNSTIDFAADDTIRLLITRKYTREGIDALMSDCGLSMIKHHQSSQSREGFAIDLLLLRNSKELAADGTL